MRQATILSGMLCLSLIAAGTSRGDAAREAQVREDTRIVLDEIHKRAEERAAEDRRVAIELAKIRIAAAKETAAAAERKQQAERADAAAVDACARAKQDEVMAKGGWLVTAQAEKLCRAELGIPDHR